MKKIWFSILSPIGLGVIVCSPFMVNSCAKNAFKNFQLENSLPTSLQNDYIATSVTLKTNISTDNFKVDYKIINDNMNDKLHIETIDDKSAKLNLDSGLVNGNYHYTIEATATKEGWKSLTVNFEFKLQITNKQFGDFTISSSLATSDTYGYSALTGNLSVNPVPVGTSVVYTFSNGSTSMYDGKLTISGSTISFAVGANAGNYNYTIKAVVSKDGYDEKIETQSFNLVIGKADLPSFNINTPTWSGTTNYGYSSVYTDLTTTSLPTDYTGGVSYSITENITGDKLSISGNRLTLATGLDAGNYDFKIKATATSDSNYNGRDSDEYTGSITVGAYDISNAIDTTSLAGNEYGNRLFLPNDLITNQDMMDYIVQQLGVSPFTEEYQWNSNDFSLTIPPANDYGEYTITVTGIGNFTGSFSVNVSNAFTPKMASGGGDTQSFNGKSYTGSASTTWAGHPISDAFDRSASTEWGTGAGQPSPPLNSWIQIQLPNSFTATSFVYGNDINTSSSQWYKKNAPSKFLLQGSNNGSDWTTILDGTNDTSSYTGPSQLRTFPVSIYQSFSYFRMTALEFAVTGGDQFTCSEFVLLGY